MYRKILLFCLSLAAFLFVSCSGTELKSDNYWNGSEQELAWVRDNSQIMEVNSDLEPTEGIGEETIPLPQQKENGEKYRIAVVISGEYWEFFDNLKGLIQGFSNIGWANSITIPSSIVTSSQLIQWISDQDYSDYVEFNEDLLWNMAWGDNTEEVEQAFFAEKPEVDLVVAYGGMAAKFFYQQDSYPIPVIADAITDPIAAGVTLSVEDSGKDFFSCKMDTEQFRQQIALFHEITGFKKLGIVYGDDEYGRIYGAVNDVERSAEELGFEIVRNTNIKEDMDSDTVDLYLAALRDVASRSDAVYIGASTAVTEYDSINEIIEILDEAKIPSFSLEGSIRVKNGILLSLSSSSAIRSGIYNATKIARALGGIRPRDLSQRFESVPAVAINLATADEIGFNIPVNVIVNSDEVFLSRDGSAATSSSRDRNLSSELTDFSTIAMQSGTAMEPQTTADGSPYRIAVLLSGSYWEFDQHFKGILNGFVSQGWGNSEAMENLSSTSVKEIISELDNYSEYVDFPPEYCIDLEWGESREKGQALLSGLLTEEDPDVDLIIAFGGVAAKLFEDYDEYPLPVLFEGITDPVGSGIIYSTEDSGRDYLTCRVDPGQYQRQVKLFHDFIGFRKLGIIYGNDEYGRLYGAVHDVEMVARQEGFTIVKNTNVVERMTEDTVDLYLAALEDLCTKVDAVYLGASTAITEYDIMDRVSEILIEHNMPSFALEGEIRVREGIMLGLSSLESEKFGLYNARKIIDIFRGENPRMLEQRMEGLPSIAINMNTAQKINRDIPLSVLSSIDQIYQ